MPLIKKSNLLGLIISWRLILNYMRKHKKAILILITGFILLGIYFSRNLIMMKWQEYKLNSEFVCPENQTPVQADTYRYKQTKFYFDNYPDITFQDFLSRRMQLLISHNCTTTLQNLANDNSGALPDKNTISELKNTPSGEDNPMLKKLGGSNY